MKLRPFLFFAVLFTGVFANTFAYNPPMDVKGTLNDFAESHLNTDYSKMERILSPQAVLKVTVGNEVKSYGQRSIIGLMKLNVGVKQNCSSTSEIIASSGAMALARVSFVYDGFIMHNYLTIEWDGGDWKITRIEKYFKNDRSFKALS